MFFFPPLTSLASSLFTLKKKKLSHTSSAKRERRRRAGYTLAGDAETAVASTSASTRKRETICCFGKFGVGWGRGGGGVEKRLKKKRRKKSATFRATAATTERADADGRTRRVVEAAVGGCGFPASFPPFFGISRCTAFRKARSCWFIAQEPGRKVAPVLGSTT